LDLRLATSLAASPLTLLARGTDDEGLNMASSRQIVSTSCRTPHFIAGMSLSGSWRMINRCQLGCLTRAA